MENNSDSGFRERPVNLDESGKRRWINARQPKGKWYNRRTVVAILLLGFFILAPIIKINGNPLMLLDVVNRKFFLFGISVWAQDTYILALVMAATVISVVLFTAVFGRVFCGWACPQTIFMEMVYRRVEFWIEGSRAQCKNQKNSKGFKIRRGIKHLLFFLITLFFTHVFVMWIVGPDGIAHLYSEPFEAHSGTWIAILLLTTLYFFIYSYFREQVCTLVCPYGRMQGVLLDSRSITVIYDHKRGEPRNPRSNEGGDCIDCRRCVNVCPTGIDIRNGMQLECINCTACIDECNTVMKKIGKPSDLIRYDSAQGVETGIRKFFDARAIGYSALLLILLVVMTGAMITRDELDTTIWRAQGTLYQQPDEKTISNIYNILIINKSGKERSVDIRLIDQEGELVVANKSTLILKDGKLQSALIVKIKTTSLEKKISPIKIGIFENGELIESVSTNFLAP